jgi:hypothetical protein
VTCYLFNKNKNKNKKRVDDVRKKNPNAGPSFFIKVR